MRWIRPKGRKGLVLLVVGLVAVMAVVLLFTHTHGSAGLATAARAAKSSATALPPSRHPIAPSAGVPAAAKPLPAGTSTWLPSSLPPNPMTLRVPILMYHYVDAKPPVPSYWGRQLTVPTERFAAEMDYLAGNGYHSVTLGQIYENMAGRQALPLKPVALTFDDGGLDDYTVAFPILRSHHFVATFFVITAGVGKPGHMTWAELKQMSMWGMAIESHTVHHRNLTVLNDASLQAELTQSRAAIRAQLGLDANFLAYPDGGCDQRVMEATQAAGYLAAVADKPGEVGDTLYPVAVYNWPRQGIGSGESLAQFQRALAGLPFVPNMFPAGKARVKRSPAEAPGRPGVPVVKPTSGLSVTQTFNVPLANAPQLGFGG